MVKLSLANTGQSPASKDSTVSAACVQRAWSQLTQSQLLQEPQGLERPTMLVNMSICQ